jgi:hypothetical protein
LPSINRQLLLLALVALFAATISLSSGHFENPDAQLRLSQAFSIVNHGSFQLADGVGNISHGNITVNEHGERYSVYGPGQIILFTPGALIAEYVADRTSIGPHYIAELFNSFLGLAVHFSTGFGVFLAAKGIGRTRSEAVYLSLLFVIATFNLPSSRDGYEHTYEAFFVMFSYAIAILHANRIKISPEDKAQHLLVMSGFLLGMGLLFRPTTILALPGLLIICGNLRGVTKVFAGLLPGMVMLGLYNALRFGSPLETGYQQAWLAANPGLVNTFDLTQMIPQSLYLWESPGKGMLFFSPILLALLLQPFLAWRRSPSLTGSILLTAFLYTLFYGANFAWHGSAWCWGPRYLIPLTPLLVLLLPLPSRSSLAGRLTAGLAIFSLAVQLGAVITNYKRHLLLTLLNDPVAFQDNRIFFDYNLSPIKAILTNIHYLFQRALHSDPLFTYLSPGPWKNEERPASIRMMLESSIDLNSFDIWWIRVLYFPLSDSTKIIGFVVGVCALTGLIYTVGNLLRRNRI